MNLVEWNKRKKYSRFPNRKEYKGKYSDELLELAAHYRYVGFTWRSILRILEYKFSTRLAESTLRKHTHRRYPALSGAAGVGEKEMSKLWIY